MNRIFNFSAGPCTLPLPALEEAHAEFLDYEGDAVDPGYGSGRMTNWDTGTYEPHKMEEEKVEFGEMDLQTNLLR